MKPKKKFTVIKDSREKKEFWNFEPDDYCNGFVEGTLHTGDYSIKELPDFTVTIERKRNLSEVYNNLFEQRFKDEIERLKQFKYRFIICQFEFKNVITFPVNSGTPARFWSGLKANSNYIMSRLSEIQIKHGIDICYAGQNSKEMAKSYLRQVAKLEGII
jgi:ERCC4-type nuclease